MIYVSSSCVEMFHIADVICYLAGHGIRNIELSGGTDYYDCIEHDLKKLEEQYKLQYACHAYFPPPKEPFVVNLASCNDEIYQQSIEHYINCIDMLKRINCKTLSIHAGFLVEIETNEIGEKLNCLTLYDEGKAYDRFCTAYENIGKLCKKYDINFYLENNVLNKENYREFGHHNYLMMTDYASVIKMKQQIDFNLLLDMGHLNVSAHTLGLDFSRECHLLAEYVKWIHVSENNGIVDEHKPLREKSEIMEQFRKLYKPGVDVTLEAKGNIDEILINLQMLRDT